MRSCASCGGTGMLRRDGRYVCAFCGRATISSLAGVLCADPQFACGQPARSLCGRCGAPLCDRHDDPKRLYWHAPLQWRSLFPHWNEGVASAWARLTAPLQTFPVEGVPAPFDWVPHARRSLYEIGRLEDEMRTELVAIVQPCGGGADDIACHFDSLCTTCEPEVARRIDEHVAGHSARYRELAYERRLTAIEAELRQRLKYVEARLGRALRPRPASPDDPAVDLDAASPLADWDRSGWEIVRRLHDVDVVRAALQRPSQ